MKKHILLVDDDKDELSIFVAAMDMTGIAYKCTWAQSGEQALSQLQYLKPDFIFLDVDMPGIDGLETLSRIRQMSGLNNVPIIMFSNCMPGSIKAKVLALGAVACLHKPYTIHELAGEIRTVLLNEPALAVA